MQKYMLFLLILVVASCSTMGKTPVEETAATIAKPTPTPQSLPEVSLEDAVKKCVTDHTSKSYDELLPPRTKVEKIDVSGKRVNVHLSGQILDYPLRPETPDQIREILKPTINPFIPGADIGLYTGDRELSIFIPPIFRAERETAEKAPEPAAPPWILRASNAAPVPTAGLFGRHLCLWGSHGWFYDARTDLRWEWQRPRMFTIVEDLLPSSFMIPFILPMVENSGGVVCYLRERDYQTNEVLVDDGDGKSNGERGICEMIPAAAWEEDDGPGFQNGLAPYSDDFNPHTKGHHHVAPVSSTPEGRVRWIPNIPEKGRYGVYVSYNMGPDRASDAHYIVHHLGGTTEFRVNQQMGGNTWVFLDYFLFDRGMNAEKGSVELTNQSSGKGTVSADCVKFGGGMGDIIRAGRTSGYPRYCEAGRYWLQYAGVKPELVYKLGYEGGADGPDYTEDYVSRAEYANFLKGAPYGPNPDRNFPGLHVPVDLAFGFHTDAGISSEIVGTLSIYTEKDDEKNLTFPDGSSRLDSNRMLADLIQTQIVDDIREKYTSTWNRRQLWDRSYSESRRGNMPSSLLELLSHQNFHDMKYALDPRFRFDVSRAIYKAFLKFLAFQNGYEPVVQPLAPTHFCITRQSRTSALLRWRPKPDPLEPSAVASGYVVYTRKGPDETLSDFDNGVYVTGTEYTAENLDPEEVYSFRVTACNAGGESFPSETLCVRTGEETENGEGILIVNAFDRIAPPSTIIKQGYSGFDRKDRGVGYMATYGLTGDQWDYDPSSKFRTNDAPGHGASDGNLETRMELGNTFDFAVRHGAAIAAMERSFDSASDEAVRDGMVDLARYAVVDWLLGEERTTHPPEGFEKRGAPDRMKSEFKTLTARDRELIGMYLEAGGSLFLSGAYVGTDLAGVPEATSEERNFLQNRLRIYWTANQGSRTNDVFAPPEGPFKGLEPFHVSSGLGEDGVYGVELPDSIKPAAAPKKAKDFETSETILRYGDNRWSAGIAMKKPFRVVVFGFPFECITGAGSRQVVMKSILDYFSEP